MRLKLPAGVTVSVVMVGSEGRVIITPRGVAADDQVRRGRMSGVITFEPGASNLDLDAATLVNATLAAGEPVFCIFEGGLADALLFRTTLSIPAGDAA